MAANDPANPGDFLSFEQDRRKVEAVMFLKLTAGASSEDQGG